MDQKDLKVKNLESLLSEATAQSELDKLVEESSVDEVEGTKLPDGTTEGKPEEGAPEVKTDDVIETVDSDKDVEGHTNKELQEETSVDEVEGTKLPDGTTESKPEEGNPEVKTDEVLDTVDSSEDVEGHENKELQEETSVDDVEGVKLPEGTLEKEPEEGAPEVKTGDVIETLDSDEDVEGHENKELQEETSVDEVEGVKLPEGISEKEPEEGNPEVKTDDVIETIDSDKDVEGHDNKELQEAIDSLNAFIEGLNEETSVDEVEGTKLPDGTTEGEPEEGAPEVKTDDVIETLDSGKDVEGHENEDKGGEKAPEAKKFEAADAVEATGGEEKSPLANLEKGNDYHSLKEAIKLGTARFESDEDKAALSEQITVLLAAENNDLLYEEYARLLTEAKAIRHAINEKYGADATARTTDLLESMTVAEEKIAAHKNDMFKKLHEQQELNAAVKSAEKVSVDEAAFGE